jgi:uncharacterized protein
VQATDYPWKGKVSITVNPKAEKNFSVRIRVPNRSVSSLYHLNYAHLQACRTAAALG